MSTQSNASEPDSHADEASRSSDRKTDEGKDETAEGQTMTRKEWIRAMNRANPLDRYLMEEKKFRKQEPPEEAIKLFRDGRIRYLLNFSPADITRLRYRKRPGHRTKDVDPAPLDMEVEGLPARSYVAIDDGFDPNVDTSSFALIEAVWADGSTFKKARRLREYNPVSASPLRTLDLTAVERDVKPVTGRAS